MRRARRIADDFKRDELHDQLILLRGQDSPRWADVADTTKLSVAIVRGTAGDRRKRERRHRMTKTLDQLEAEAWAAQQGPDAAQQAAADARRRAEEARAARLGAYDRELVSAFDDEELGRQIREAPCQGCSCAGPAPGSADTLSWARGERARVTDPRARAR